MIAKPVMRFRQCRPKIWHLGILNILGGRNLGKWQEQDTLIFCHHHLPQFFALKQVIDLDVRGALPMLGGKEHSYL